MKAFALGNAVGLLFAGVVVALSITGPDKTEDEKLAERTRAGDREACFIEYMRAPMRLRSNW